MRGRIEVNSFFSQTRSHPAGCPQGGGRTIFWKSVQKGCPVPSGVPSSALSSVPGASSQEQGCLFLCGSQEVSRAPSGRPRAAAASHGGSRVSPRAGWLAGASGSVQEGPRKPNVMPAGNLDLLSEARVQSLSLSPLLCLLPLSSDCEVKVKRANVPDLPDTVSWSGHLLGINKINLTKENRTKERKRRKEIPTPPNLWM